MCGMYGFVGKRADVNTLIQCADAASTRGGHASALVWSSNGTLHQSRMRGVMRASVIRLAGGARLVLGHERWATSGDPKSLAETHPFVRGDLYLMHNGIVGNYAALSRRYASALATRCDSEVLAVMIGERVEAGEPLASACEAVLGIVGGWGGIIAMRGNELVACTHHCPLFVARRPEGHYFCSRDIMHGRRIVNAESWRVDYAIPAAA